MALGESEVLTNCDDLGAGFGWGWESFSDEFGALLGGHSEAVSDRVWLKVVASVRAFFSDSDGDLICGFSFFGGPPVRSHESFSTMILGLSTLECYR